MGPAKRVAGYAALAKFMASDKVFCIFRRFDVLSVRTLLRLQDELSELEQRLEAVDEADHRQGGTTGLQSLHSWRIGQTARRTMLMLDIENKLYAYRESL